MSANNQERIDNYLLKKMSPQEHASFLKDMKNNTELAAEAHQQQQTLNELEAFGDLEVTKRVRQIHQEEMRRFRNQKLKIMRFRIFSVAAVFLLLLGVFWWFNQATPSNQELFATHYETYQLSFGSRDGTIEQRLLEASTAYGQGNFEAALPDFEFAHAQRPNDTKVQLALGMTYFETGNTEAALNLLNELIVREDPLYKTPALWYTALIYLRQEEVSKSKQLLQQVVAENGGGKLKQQAQKLLKELEEK